MTDSSSQHHQPLPSHPAPADPAATSSGVPADAATKDDSSKNGGGGASTAHRGMTSTNTWKPAIDRRQSWSKEEYKHSVQMGGIADGRGDKVGPPGFSST